MISATAPSRHSAPIPAASPSPAACGAPDRPVRRGLAGLPSSCGAHTGYTVSSNRGWPTPSLTRQKRTATSICARARSSSSFVAETRTSTPRMVGGETVQPRNQPQRGKTGRGGDGHLAQLGAGAHAGRGVAQALQAIDHGALQHLAGLGQRQRAVPALEQRHAQAGLDLLDLPAHRRLREKQLFGGVREAQRARGGLEAAQQVEPGQFRALDGARQRRRELRFRILCMHANDSN